jgi:crotonobetainyl-CoA:carnitine CoA-transferase CaiB-like acyl-CoA transferase
MLVQMPHPTIGTARLAGTPLNLSATPAQMRLPPPLLGEHTDAILARLLGLDDRAIAELHCDGVV